MDTENPNNADEQGLLEKAAQGDSQALETVLNKYRGRLRRMIKLRLDPRMQGRIDPSDVLQEAYLDFCKHLAEYLQDPKMPFFLWLRLLAGQKLALAHRQHLGVQARDVSREISLYRGPFPGASSAALAAQLLGKLTSPSVAAVKAELRIRLQEALNSMNDVDREVLTLRHFEHLTNSETSLVLGIKESAAANRYIRALERLRAILNSVPGFLGDSP